MMSLKNLPTGRQAINEKPACRQAGDKPETPLKCGIYFFNYHYFEFGGLNMCKANL